MLIFDLVHNVKAAYAWAGATISTDTDTASTTIIDSQGFGSAMFVAQSGTITDGTYRLQIIECDNADGSTGAAEVGSYQKQESFVAASDTTVKVVGARLTKRYCKLQIHSTGTTSGGVFAGATALLGGAYDEPVGLAKL